MTLWRTGVRKPKRFTWKGSSLTIAWSPDARYIASGEQDNTVHLWMAENGEDLEMSGYHRKVKELAWNVDSRYLATGGGNVVTIWDCAGKGPAGTQPICLQGPEESVTAMTFANTGDWIATGDDAGRIIRWSLSDESTRTSVHLASGIATLSWSADDELLAAGTAHGALSCVGF